MLFAPAWQQPTTRADRGELVSVPELAAFWGTEQGTVPAGKSRLCAAPATHQERLIQYAIVEHAEDGRPAAHTPAVLAPAHAVICFILHREHHHA